MATGSISGWNPSPLPSVAPQEPTVDKDEVVRLKASVSRQEGIWEADLFYVPTPTREKRMSGPTILWLWFGLINAAGWSWPWNSCHRPTTQI